MDERPSLPTSLAQAQALDRADPLGPLARAFALPDKLIYLDGHSLGPAPHAALTRVHQTTTTEWAQGLIRSWNDAGWIEWPARVGAKLAPLIGAQAHEVLITDSVSVNLFKLAAGALGLARQRCLYVEDDEFPTDQYVAQGLAALVDAPMVRLASGDALSGLTQGGVLIKSLVNYRTAALADMATLERAARAAGALIIWDLSHATGVVPVAVNRDGARLAVGCTYKYLNGGPGAPAFVFAAAETPPALTSPIAGWFGHADPFAFTPSYEPAKGVTRFAAGTPGILSLSALDGALDVFAGLSMEAVAAKAAGLSALALQRATALGLEVLSPLDPAQRGGHIALRHAEGFQIVQALIERGVIGDFRAPDTIRFGFSPLFLGWADVWHAMDALTDILATHTYKDSRFAQKGIVT